MNRKQKKLHKKISHCTENPSGYPHRIHHKNKKKVSEKRNAIEEIKKDSYKKNLHKVKVNLKHEDLIH
jgi:hypothetical protein